MIGRTTRRIRLICLAMALLASAAGVAAGQPLLGASTALGLATGAAYFQLLGLDAARQGKRGILNAAIVLAAKCRLLLVIGAAIAAARVPGLSVPATLLGVVATHVAFLVAASRD